MKTPNANDASLPALPRLALPVTALLAALVLAAAPGCGSSAGTSGQGGGSTTSSTSTGAGSVTGVRGERYCEILVGKLGGATVHVDVYNTFQLNDCPEDQWAAVDAAQVKTEEMADVVILNGPRYWVMDAFVGTSLVDPTPRAVGGIQMRLAGTLDLPLSQAQGGNMPYAPRSVNRTTTWVYEAGKSVYELVDPSGRVFDMQSYSVQTTAQTLDSLAGLGATLAPPAGWSFRTRVISADLQVTAVNGEATIVQDERENTYQLSQQMP
jgi:hypothetical protein